MFPRGEKWPGNFQKIKILKNILNPFTETGRVPVQSLDVPDLLCENSSSMLPYCLGPIARPQLGACPSHSKAAAHPHSPLTRQTHCAHTTLVYQQHSNKDTSLTIHTLSLYLYTETHTFTRLGDT